MTPIVHAQKDTDSPYASRMGAEFWHFPLLAGWLDYDMSRLLTEPKERWAVFFNGPARDPESGGTESVYKDNLRQLKEWCETHGSYPELVIDHEGPDIHDPDSAVRQQLRNRILAPILELFPPGIRPLYGNYATSNISPEDTQYCIDFNMYYFPGGVDATEFPVQSPVVNYWTARSDHPAYNNPHAQVGLGLNLILAIYRHAERNSLPQPIIHNWLAAKDSTSLDSSRWFASVAMAFLLSGPTQQFFNGDHYGTSVDADLTAVCEAVEANTAGAKWVKPRGVSIAGRPLYGSLSGSTYVAESGDISAFAELSDGSVVGMLLRPSSSGAATKAVTIPGESTALTFEFEDGQYYAWSRVTCGTLVDAATRLQSTLDAKADQVALDATNATVVGLSEVVSDKADQTSVDTAVAGVSADLVSGLAGKANTSHTHTIADVTSLQSSLDGKAATSHTHAISGVTGLQTALDGKAATTHTHAITDVTGLQTALDSKASTSSLSGYLTTTGNGGSLTGLTKSQVGLSNVSNVDTTNAANITSGTLGYARLPAATTTTQGAMSSGDKAKLDGISVDSSNNVGISGNLTVTGSSTQNGPIYNPYGSIGHIGQNWFMGQTNFHDSSYVTRVLINGHLGTVDMLNTSTPAGTPSGGGVLYVESGALKYKGSSGTVTTVAPA